MPVFVLGSVRSATSTVVEILRRHGGFAGHPEGHLWPLLAKLQSASLSHFLDNSVPLDATRPGPNEPIPLIHDLGYPQVYSMLQQAFRNAVEQRYERDWVDKTPGHEAIQMAPQLREIFPTAKFIYCYRDPRANLRSRMAKFPDQCFETHCIELAMCWQAWLSARHDLSDACFIVSQTEWADNFPATASALLSFATGEVVTWPSEVAPIGIERFGRSAHSPWTADMEHIYLRHCGFLEAMDNSFPAPAAREHSAVHAVKFLPVVSHGPVIRMQSPLSPLSSAIFNQSDERGRWLFLHPGHVGSAVTRVTFEGFRFDGDNEFSTVANVNHASSGAVRFAIELRPSGTSIVSFRSSIVVQALESRPWAETFDAHYGEYDISLSTEMVGANAEPAFAWARLLEPAFLTPDPQCPVGPDCHITARPRQIRGSDRERIAALQPAGDGTSDLLGPS